MARVSAALSKPEADQRQQQLGEADDERAAEQVQAPAHQSRTVSTGHARPLSRPIAHHSALTSASAPRLARSINESLGNFEHVAVGVEAGAAQPVALGARPVVGGVLAGVGDDDVAQVLALHQVTHELLVLGRRARRRRCAGTARSAGAGRGRCPGRTRQAGRTGSQHRVGIVALEEGEGRLRSSPGGVSGGATSRLRRARHTTSHTATSENAQARSPHTVERRESSRTTVHWAPMGAARTR